VPDNDSSTFELIGPIQIFESSEIVEDEIVDSSLSSWRPLWGAGG